METNNLSVATAPITPTTQPKSDCGCGGAVQTGTHEHDDDDDCPCKRRAIKKMIVGGVILVVLGVAAYGAWRMGYFDKAISFVKSKIKKIG